MANFRHKEVKQSTQGHSNGKGSFKLQVIFLAPALHHYPLLHPMECSITEMTLTVIAVVWGSYLFSVLYCALSMVLNTIISWCTFLEYVLQTLFYKIRKLKFRELEQLVQVHRVSGLSDLAGILALVCLNPISCVLFINVLLNPHDPVHMVHMIISGIGSVFWVWPSPF